MRRPPFLGLDIPFASDAKISANKNSPPALYSFGLVLPTA
jgi:hypothetical protein